MKYQVKAYDYYYNLFYQVTVKGKESADNYKKALQNNNDVKRVEIIEL